MCSEFGELDIQEIKEDVLSLCRDMNLPVREVYVSADFKEEVYQVEVELFKEYSTIEELLKEELDMESRLSDRYGKTLAVNIISLDEED